ncbi:Rho termination factor N-terminal domain-containing protein [Bacillus paramycoides]|uniref:Rho termination factor N-terminal domain-containing protein n=1 Tax=Bacillus paramycoides TaxID=2026194 RepID=UPI002E1E3850|nr:Rho termination factor N-terminal domain-containing protein [Bacillus paramycoides]MED1462568.1 Rho termination factor N-terminal domain-containing protein [Bacillus paramycoides]MED1493989.1 Rho termination factor N-terminal domain-containing protein [Bacillus paramycoides]
MITEIRKTISGTEYWDSEKKRSLFVPTGEEPGFEVTENPESMIMSVDLANGKDMTVVSEVPVLSNMTVKELREYADELGIEIPADVKKKEDIIELLS